MTILAIDTSTDYLSIAVMKNGKVSAKFHKKADMRHSILLVPTIAKMLGKARLKAKDIDCFAISIGPGSFTGLRIGVTVVKGMAYALKKNIVTIPTLDVIAMNAGSFAGVVCPVLDARKNKVYACLYRSNGKTIKKISKYLLLPFDELLNKTAGYDKVLFLGDYSAAPQLNRGNIDWHPKAEIVAEIGSEYFKKKKFVKCEDLEPMYIYSRECDITGK